MSRLDVKNLAMKKWQAIVISLTAGIIYLLPYGIMKVRCSSPSYAYLDPWIGQYPQTRITSNIRHWGDSVNHWDKSDWSDVEIKMNYRDPGYEFRADIKRMFNWIYVPMQKCDEGLTGWAVRFLVFP